MLEAYRSLDLTDEKQLFCGNIMADLGAALHRFFASSMKNPVVFLLISVPDRPPGEMPAVEQLFHVRCVTLQLWAEEYLSNQEIF